MDFIVVPGINGLGKTLGCEESYKRISANFEKINLNKGNICEQLNNISKKTNKFFDRQKCVFFGGDHSISYPLVLNFFKKYKGEGRLLVFDAHPDTMDFIKEPTHEEWLQAIIEEGFAVERILIVGIRRNSENVDVNEIKYLKDKKINFIYSDEFENKKEEIVEFLKSPLYVSFDIDVFDSNIVSCTGYPEKNGLDEKQVFPLLEKISKIKEGVFFDLVEVNLDKGNKEEKNKTILIVEKILKTIDSKE